MTSLTINSQGNLYGTTTQHSGPSGTFSDGTVFEWSPSTQSFSTIYSFGAANGGLVPLGPLTVDDKGDLFGTTSITANSVASYGTVFEIDGESHALTTLAFFNGPDGATPTGSLLLQNGMLYGTTEYGGLSNQGVLFEVAAPEPASIAMLVPFIALLPRRRTVTA
jgi:uncharacterized repeat protein (TIGR03803 family)